MASPPEIDCPHCGKPLEVVSVGGADCPFCGTFFIVHEDHSVSHVTPYRSSPVLQAVCAIGLIAVVGSAFVGFESKLFAVAFYFTFAIFNMGYAIVGYRKGTAPVDAQWVSRHNEPGWYDLYLIAMFLIGLLSAALGVWEFFKPT